MMLTSGGVKSNSFEGEEFSLVGVFKSLAKEDFERSVELAKSFKNGLPRATATFAIASSVLDDQAEKREGRKQ